MDFKKLNEKLREFIEEIKITGEEYPKIIDVNNFINSHVIVEDELRKRDINYKIIIESEFESWGNYKFYELLDFNNIDFYLRPMIKDQRKKIPELYVQFNYRTPALFNRLKQKKMSDFKYCIWDWEKTYYTYKNKLFNWSNEKALKIYTKEFLDFYLPLLKQEKLDDDYIVARREGTTYIFGKKFKTLEDIKNALGQAYDYIMKKEMTDKNGEQYDCWEPCKYWGPENILKLGPMYYDEEEGLSSKEDFINYNLNYFDFNYCFYYKNSEQTVNLLKIS